MGPLAKPLFSPTTYAAFRPVYPQKLYDLLLSYHRGPRDLAVDLGSGHGIVARALSPSFAHVVATDPSSGMLDKGRALCAADDYQNISFREAAAESLPFVATGSADMVTAGQAAHWFDAAPWFAEMARIVRPGGTLAVWGYKDHVFPEHTRATALLDRWCHRHTLPGEEAEGEGLGDYWTEPGRSRVQDKLRAIVPPGAEWEDVRRIEYEPGTEGLRSGVGEILLEKRMTITENMQYVRTWSSYQAWKKAHPEAKARAEGGDGDIVDASFDKMKEAEPEWKALPMDQWLEKEVDVEWGSGIVLARRRET